MPQTDSNTLDKIINRLGELPAAPVILDKALKLTSDVQSDINDISRNISADQTLAAKVIRLSNSPLYGRIKRISSLNEAIRVLGFNQIKSIIITATTFQVFQSGTHTRIANILWEHSLATALGARLIVQKFGCLDKEEAYLCGLLHDIGKLVLLKIIPHTYEKIIDQVKETNLPFIQVENKELGFNHVDVGNKLLTQWDFPEDLASQIATHHSINPNQKSSSMSLAGVITISNSVAKYIGAGFFEPYRAIGSVVYLGNKLIREDDIISLFNDTEEQFNFELNTIYSQ